MTFYMYDHNNNGTCTTYIWYYDALCTPSWVVLEEGGSPRRGGISTTSYKIWNFLSCIFKVQFIWGRKSLWGTMARRHLLLELIFCWWCKFLYYGRLHLIFNNSENNRSLRCYKHKTIYYELEMYKIYECFAVLQVL